MALDREDIKFITEQNNAMEKRLTNTIQGQGSGVRAKIESEVNRIDEMDKKRNGKIKSLEKQTHVFRWAHRNPKTTIIIVIIFIAFVTLGMHQVNVKRTIEKHLKIELNENQ